MKRLTIGQVAHRSGVRVETVRYYERKGLIAKAERTNSGYRLFDEEDVARLLFIKGAKELGIKLDEIKELLSCELNLTQLVPTTLGNIRISVQ